MECDESPVQTVRSQHPPRRAVDRLRRDALAHRGDGGQLGFQDRLVQPPDFGAGPSQECHAGHVAGVAVPHRRPYLSIVTHCRLRVLEVGLACGKAERRPEATMVSKAGFSAPSLRMRYSISAARSISLTPGADQRQGLGERLGIGEDRAADQRRSPRAT